VRDKHGEDVTDWLKSHTIDELSRPLRRHPIHGPRRRAAPEHAEPAASFRLTDLGNAERLVANFRQDILHADEVAGSSGAANRWRATPEPIEVIKRAGLTVRSIVCRGLEVRR